MGAGGAYGVGLATIAVADGSPLDSWFPTLGLDPTDVERVAAVVGGTGTHILTDVPTALDGTAAGATIATLLGGRGDVRRPDVRRVVIATALDDLGTAPRDPHDAMLRLHLLSHRLVRPHGLALDGVFGLLPNVVWTDLGPFPVDGYDRAAVALAADGVRPRVRAIDRFPRMTDYVVPSGVRIADADRVRLGAHLAAGTTVMHEGFVNFNAGTLGTSMVEGRISAGVVVGDGSDLGGGASIMGTLSGGGQEVIRVGERCLIGANAGIGISLGDDCVVEAGLYVTAGTKVTLPDGRIVAARRLSGRDGMLLRRDSITGRVELVDRGAAGTWTGLNADLHAND